MSRYKLGNCEQVFKESENVLRQLDVLKEDIRNMYAIVQNDGTILENDDLENFSVHVGRIFAKIQKFETTVDLSLDRILDHIELNKIDG